MQLRRGWTLRAASIGLSIGVVLGCGGGGAIAPKDSGGPPQQVGPMSVEGSVQQLQPEVTAGGSTIYSVVGNVTRASMIDANPTVEETEVVFVAGIGTSFAILACSPDGSGIRTIAKAPLARDLRVTSTHVYYIDSALSILYRVPLQGGTPSKVKANITRYSLNLSGSKIYGYQPPSGSWPQGRFLSFNTDGTGTTTMFAAPFQMIGPDAFPGLLSDGSLVLMDYQSSSYTLFKAMSPSGILRSYTEHTNGVDIAGMENGTDLVYFRDSGYFERFLAGGGSVAWPRQSLSQPIRYDSGLGISPGGTHVAFSNLALQPLDGTGIWVDKVTGTGGQRIYPQRAFSVAWTPFVQERTFVGYPGWPASVGAFLFSERGAVLPAVVWVDAVTRNSITITQIASGGQNVVYRIDCDDLNKLWYSNSLNYTPTKLVEGASGFKGAFVSFNAETGKVESVSPFTRAPASYP